MISNAALLIPVTKIDHSQGPKDAPLVLVEYGDYECPYCGLAYPIIKRVQAALKKDLRFVFRNFPQAIAHPHAIDAAKAAEAAGLQGKFWEMHDTLYENQENLDPNSLLEYATTLNLDLEKFIQDMGSQVLEEKIAQDQYGGARSCLGSLPN